MHAAVVVPADEFGEYTPKMPLIPDQHSVETLPAQRPYHPLDVCRRIGRAIRDGYALDAHFLPEPLIVCRSTRNSLPSGLHSNRSIELSELSIVVVEHELGLFVEAGIPYLLFRPLEGWMIGYMKVYDLSTGNLHDDEHIKDLKRDRVLHEEVTGPHGLGLVLQKASPGLGICWSRTPFDHVSTDGRAGVANTKLHLQLQGDAILPVLGMIRGYPPDEVDVFIRNGGSARPAPRLPPPELPKLPISPSDHGLRPHEDQLRCPVPPYL